MPKAKDLTGNIYGELIVVEMLYNYNNSKRTYCRCMDTNNDLYIVRQDALQSGSTQHAKGACKAGRPEDISGQKFGRLTAEYPTDKRAPNHGIIWMCKCDCGNKILVPSCHLKKHHTTSCGCAKRSKVENIIVEYLNSQNVEYETEKTFDDLKNPNNTMNLYFDFYFPDLHVVIEYDGEQHYFPFKYFGGEKRLEYIQICDNIKNQYCANNNITMVRIPYTTTHKEIIQIIDKAIHP